MSSPDDGSANAAELANFLDALTSTQDVQGRWNHLTRFMGNHGADVINYAVLNTLEFNREEAPVTQFSTMSSDWIEHYLDHRLDLHDPHVRYAREGKVQPYRWGEGQTSFLMIEAERKTLALAAEAGLRSQISMVAPDPSGRGAPIGGMTIGSSLRAGEYFRAIDGKESMLLSAAMLYHNSAIGEIRRHQVDAIPLSPRERDCMTYVARGLRTVRIAERLGLSEVTVELYLRNARRKLKAATTAQAVARAMIFGDVKL